MTILSTAQNAIAQLVGERPPAVVSSQDTICVEVTAIAREAAVDIAESYDWQALTKFHTITADGSGSYPFPTDYHRMVQRSEVFDPNNWAWGYNHVPAPSDWLFYLNNSTGLVPPGIWQIRDNKFHFLPEPPVSASAVFPYITRNLFIASNGAMKDDITSDQDKFVLDERLLKLAIIWRWLSIKRMDYQQELDDYNRAMDRAAADDRGARGIKATGPWAIPGDVRNAYPWPLGS